ncbi:MAG: bifunctional riboflavin kinase/FAD synthetase [Bacteroidetes bacterium]|nr:bifunctional riboflavin kinase/FAD synthetase [Bacteroidota bacterium]
MQVYHSLDSFPRGAPVALTLGTFDGVHFGHQRIIQKTLEAAKEIEGQSVLLTFDPHPREVIGRDGKTTYLLTTVEERLSLLQALGLDVAIVLPFTRDLSVLDAAVFFREFILRSLQAQRVVIGVDHAFGRGRQGDAAALRTLGEEYGIEVSVISELLIGGVKVSSTAIRNALKQGDVRQAREFLGRPYTLSGVVIRGADLGTSLGFPTANIELMESNKLLPKNGVYVVRVRLNGFTHQGIMNIGLRPTVSEQMHISLEVHIFDFNADVYGMHMQVDLLERLRDEIRFEGTGQLAAQIQADIDVARSYMKKEEQRIID